MTGGGGIKFTGAINFLKEQIDFVGHLPGKM